MLFFSFFFLARYFEAAERLKPASINSRSSFFKAHPQKYPTTVHLIFVFSLYGRNRIQVKNFDFYEDFYMLIQATKILKLSITPNTFGIN